MDHNCLLNQSSIEEHDFDGIIHWKKTCQCELPYSPVFVMVFVLVPSLGETVGISFLFSEMGCVMLS